MSTTTWNSLLLSKGSIFSTTAPSTGSATDTAISPTTARPSRPRLRRPRRSSSSGRKMRSNSGAIQRARPCPAALPLSAWCVAFIHKRASQGVTVNAMASDSSMPMLALMGMGLMYGPISPLTKAIGSRAAMTVKVARMVGPPTSSTAPGMISRRLWPACRP